MATTLTAAPRWRRQPLPCSRETSPPTPSPYTALAWNTPGDRVLRQIAAATGGRAFLLPSFGQASRIFAEIEDAVRGRYVVGFRPVGRLRDGEFHFVKLVARRRGVVIRARSGYYVNPADQLLVSSNY